VYLWSQRIYGYDEDGSEWRNLSAGVYCLDVVLSECDLNDQIRCLEALHLDCAQGLQVKLLVCRTKRTGQCMHSCWRLESSHLHVLAMLHDVLCTMLQVL
jgi:hypothetical protein